jgi:hypothetical protein
MVLEFIQKYADTMITNNQTWTATNLEEALFREGYNVVFCVPASNGSKFRVHIGDQNFIEGVLTSTGEILL